MPFFRHYYTTFDYGQSESAGSMEKKKPSIWVAEATESCEPKKHQELLQIEAGKEKGSTASLLEVDQSQLRLPHWMGKKDREHLQFWISECLFWIAWGSDKGHKCLRSLSAADLTGPNLGCHNPACGRYLGQKKSARWRLEKSGPKKPAKKVKKWQAAREGRGDEPNFELEHFFEGSWTCSLVKKCFVFSSEISDICCYVPSKIEWDLTNGPPKEVARAIRYSGLGVRSVGPVGDFLDMSLGKMSLLTLSWNPKQPVF